MGATSASTKPSNHPAAKVLATLAMCMFSGLIFWVFRRPKRRQSSTPRPGPSLAGETSPPNPPGFPHSCPTCSIRELELHGSVQRLLSELSKARSHADQQQAALATKGQEVDAKTAECSLLLKSLEQRSHEVGVLQADCSRMQDQKKELLDELVVVKGAKQGLEAEVQKLQNEAKELQQQLAARVSLQTTNELLDKRIQELGVQLEGALLAKVKSERDYERALAESRQEAERHQQASVRAVNEYEKIRDKSAEALRKMGLFQAEMGRITSELDQVRRERTDLLNQQAAEKEVKRQLEAALASERARSRALELENRNAHEVMCNMEARLRALERGHS